MIKSLPRELPSSFLSSFVVGNQEAIRDQLLDKCFCRTAPVNQFLRGEKDILLGVKGSGKSAVFRQLLDKQIEFNNPNKLRQILVPIDQDVDYLSVKYHLHESLESVVADEDVRVRFIWEIYILYRICSTLLISDIELDQETRSTLEVVVNHFSFETRTPTILELFTKANRTFGCKLDVSHMGFPVPDFYIKTEPNTEAKIDPRDIKEISINISDIQAKINAFLRRTGAVVFVLIDNLDDFLAREEYEAQRLVIQGLLACSKDYSRHAYLKIRLFLRNEVFHKVDFEKIGGGQKK